MLPSDAMWAGKLVVAALGVNVWASMVLIPGLYLGTLRGPAVLYALLPLVALAAGVGRRSPPILLLLVPALLVPALVRTPRLLSDAVYGPTTFALIAIGLTAYVFAAAALTGDDAPDPAERVRPLGGARAPMPPRWRRRFRIYRGLAVLSIVTPLVLLVAANFAPRHLAFLGELYPGRVASMRTLLNLGVLALALGIHVTTYAGVLELHRTGDPTLGGELTALRGEVRRARPRPIFYLAVLVALGLMFRLVWLR